MEGQPVVAQAGHAEGRGLVWTNADVIPGPHASPAGAQVLDVGVPGGLHGDPTGRRASWARRGPELKVDGGSLYSVTESRRDGGVASVVQGSPAAECGTSTEW